MRYYLSLILAGICVVTLRADEPKTAIVPHINQQGNIIVEVPDELENILEFKQEEPSQNNRTETVKKKPTIGYRVEIFADNNARTAKSQALSRRRNVSARLPQYATYLLFESPYWRVRVGDFPSRSEAQTAMSQIRSAFPAYSHDLRIVRSRIK